MDSRPTRAVVLVAWTPLSPSPQAPGHARNLMQCAAGFIEFRSRISLVPTMTPRRLGKSSGFVGGGQKLACVYYEAVTMVLC
jgi:hypothetical protein